MAESRTFRVDTPFFTFLFKVGQEREDSGRVQIRQIEPRNRLIPLSGEKTQ